MSTISIPKLKIFTETNEVHDPNYFPLNDVDEISSSSLGNSEDKPIIAETNRTCIEDHIPKLTERTQEAHSLIEIFKLFLPDELSIHILDMSNIKLKTFLDSHPEFLNKRYYQLITLPELLAFFGLMIEIGALRLSRESIDSLYFVGTTISYSFFISVMPIRLFPLILHFLRFDDASTTVARQKIDNLVAIRFIVESLKTNLLANYLPGQWVTVDEHLCRYRGRCFFKQIIPSKPDRYGIKIYVLADSTNYFPITFEVYSGKHQLSNKTEDLVMRLSSLFLDLLLLFLRHLLLLVLLSLILLVRIILRSLQNVISSCQFEMFIACYLNLIVRII